MRIIITNSGLIVPRAEFMQHFAAKWNLIKKELTITHKIFNGQKMVDISMCVYRLYKGPPEILCFARFSGLRKILLKYAPPGLTITYVNNMAMVPSGLPEKYQPGITLKPNQQIIYDHLMENVYSEAKIATGAASCVLVMDTGQGKTFMTGKLIETFRQKALIILPNSSGINEWKKMLAGYLPQLSVGEYHSKAPRPNGTEDVIITTINGAIAEEYTFGRGASKKIVTIKEYFRQFGFIAYDEVHNYPTPQFSEAFWRTNSRQSIGLSATPDERSDGMDEYYPRHLGPLVVAEDIPGFNKVEIDWKGRVKAVMYQGPPDYTRSLYTSPGGPISHVKMCKQFAEDPHRNKLILREVRDLYERGRNIFVFSEFRDYLQKLLVAIHAAGLPVSSDELAEEMHILMGGTKEEVKQKANDARIILITHKYGKESISYPHMDTIIFATPRRNKLRQTLGRILRMSGNVDIVREIVDIVDESTSIKTQYGTRKKLYKSKNFPIEKVEVKYQDLA